jgi:hypothetical protein
MFPHLYPHTTEANQWRAIHPECINCCLAGWCQTDHFRGSFVPGEMICLSLLLRMKQGDDFTKRRSNSSLSMSFIAVTGGTRQAKIFRDSFTTCPARDDVLDFKDRYRERFGCATVGTTIRKLRTDLTP